MRLVLLGAPGSGKGTQAQRLRDEKGIPQVSSGDLLRDAVKRGTELGKRAKAAMDAGELVSDEIVLGLIRERLGRPDLPLACVLEGGTWAAGRELAQELRGGDPPLAIRSDGTVF